MEQVFRLSLIITALLLICGGSAFAQTPTPTPTPNPIAQLTASDKDSFATDVDGNGLFIVIESTGNLGSTSIPGNNDNADGNREIFLLDFQRGITFQITHTRSALRDPSGSPTDRANILVEISNNKPVISHDARFIAFGSNATTPGNFNGNNHPGLSSDGNSEMFLYQIPAAGTNLSTGSFRSITATPASRPPQGGTANTSPIFADDNRSAALNDNGSLLAFVSTRDILPGRNTDGNPEIFIFNRTTGGFSQITETEGTFTFNENPSLSGPPGGNTVLAFISNANITQNNSDGNAEVYVANFNGSATTSINQVTRTSSSATTNPIVNILSPGRRLSRNGNFIAFESTANLTSDGAIQSTFAIFVYNIAANTFTQAGQRSAPGTEVALRFPTFTGDNSRLIFSSALNFNTDGTIATSGGLNPDRRIQIFSTPVPGPGTPVALTRLTNIPAQGNPGQGQPSLQAYPSDTQNRIAFTVRLNLVTGGNDDNSVEAFFLTLPSTGPGASHSIGGQIKVGTSGPALNGATVTLTSTTAGFATRTAQTDATGKYTFTGLPAGRTYTVKSAKTNYSFTPTQKSFTALNANQTANFTAATAAPRTYSITGRVVNISGRGIQGVTVRLGGTRTLSATTNSQGYYSFTGLPAGGNYTVKPAFGGMSFDPLNKTFSNLSANQTTTTATFLVVFTIRGRVVRAGTATGIGGVTMKLIGPTGRTTTTDSNGNYRFDQVPAGGNYAVQPTKSGMSFSPGVQKFSLLDSNKTASHFSGTPN